jgi:crotonobetainyl-CoA:carnitine CoA-transferase CaiB-like acyl-CoA transferase
MLPLKGLKILDFTTLLPGPYATQILADMGADVLRIEAPKRPDLLKMMPPMIGKVSAAHASINRNKKSLALDLKQAEAKDIIYTLLQDYDIVIEQFRPGVMAKLGLDFTSLKTKQSKLIYCSITGYGQTGPLKDKAGHDINYLALSGLASYSGRDDTGPVLSGTQIADIAGGSHHAVMAILAAVIERTNTGKGQYLDISMSDAALALNTMFGASALVSQKDPTYGAEMLNGGLFYDYYKTADDRYLSIGSLEPIFANRLMARLGLQDLLPKLMNQSPSVQQEVKQAIATEIVKKSQEEWQHEFSGLDACVEPVLSISEASQHPHFIERNMLCEAEDEHGNKIKQINTALPFKSLRRHKAGVKLGSNTKEILRSISMSEEQIQTLRDRGCIVGD